MRFVYSQKPWPSFLFLLNDEIFSCAKIAKGQFITATSIKIRKIRAPNWHPFNIHRAGHSWRQIVSLATGEGLSKTEIDRSLMRFPPDFPAIRVQHDQNPFSDKDSINGFKERPCNHQTGCQNREIFGIKSADECWPKSLSRCPCQDKKTGN